MIGDLKHYGLKESTINNLSEFFVDDEGYESFMDAINPTINWKDFFELFDGFLIAYKGD